MNELLSHIPLFCIFFSVGAYLIGLFVHSRLRLTLLSPFVISVALVIAFLLIFGIDFTIYQQGAQYLSYLLTPATVCLAIPLYEKRGLLIQEWKAVLLGITFGVLINATAILAFSVFFGLTHTQYVTLLPKSVTAAIAIPLSTKFGGVATITIAATTITGITGNMLAPLLCRLFRIRDPIARGVAIGTASHVIGTARAMEMGRTEGAMSGLSIAITGVITVLFAFIFAGLL